MNRLFYVIAGAAVIAALPQPVAAQEYPAKPVRLILPYQAGANPDVVARTIAQKLAEFWKQPVIVDNRAAGSGGIAGLQAVLAAPSDGYTVLMGAAGNMTISPSLYKLPYDTARDFDAITMLAYVPNVLVLNPSLPVKTLKEFIALAKSQPGRIDYASSASGTISHFAGEVFNWRAGVKLTHIPYKGSPSAITATLSGETAVMFSPVPLAMPHIQKGRLRALGVTTLQRSTAMPELPTLDEAGLKAYEATQWYALFVRAGTAREIVRKINTDVTRVLDVQDVRSKLTSQGTDPHTSTPEELAGRIKSEIPKWAPIVKASGARPG